MVSLRIKRDPEERPRGREMIRGRHWQQAEISVLTGFT